jgi:hypothetical protein
LNHPPTGTPQIYSQADIYKKKTKSNSRAPLKEPDEGEGENIKQYQKVIGR